MSIVNEYNKRQEISGYNVTWLYDTALVGCLASWPLILTCSLWWPRGCLSCRISTVSVF